jgi:acyl-CoA synthetase (NDP forming)
VISQSGGMCAVTYGLLRGRGLGVRHAHATGNEADVTVADLAWAVAHDPDVKLVLLYLETIVDPATLARAAGVRPRARPAILAVKAGRSTSGQKAASSPARSQTRIGSSTRSSATTASCGCASRTSWRSPRRPISRAGGRRAGVWW